ncbi:MAG: signal recognition particle-docking protein FtsY [Acidimicrobiia bacterium]
MDTTTLVILLLAALVLVAVAMLLIRSRRPDTEIETSEPEVRSRLARSATVIGAGLKRAWGSGLAEETWEELEEVLLAADVGVEATTVVVAGVKASAPGTAQDARTELGDQLRRQLRGGARQLTLEGSPSVILMVGVNGSGKTTSIAKLAARLLAEGETVVLAAADTFRAAAGAQLSAWGERLDVRVIAGEEGADPASVAFDAISSARAGGTDVVIVDTAGRLHAKKNLMAELSKIHRVAAGERGEVDEVLVVLDATGGQNGLAQVRVFAEAVPVTGIVLTKLDGTARGGIVIAVEKELGVPVKFVGLGEGLDDLVPFDPDRFVSDLLEFS